MAKISYVSVMLQIVRKILIFILVVDHDCMANTVFGNKFVYEKDISEYCVRRVVPSVFLGRQAMDAYSQVLYFSKMDLPYSCFISIRAESGSNIILMVQLSSSEDLKATCEKNPNQLTVFELGETFGGYWGPQEVVKKSKKKEPWSRKSDLYTLKHVAKESATTSMITPDSEEATSDETQTPGDKIGLEDLLQRNKEDFITVDVPLVNVSAYIIPGVEPDASSIEDENFDLIYNVRPRPQGVYITTEVPLAQFSIEGTYGWGYKESRNPLDSIWNKFSSLSGKRAGQNRPLKLEDTNASEGGVDVLSMVDFMPTYNSSHTAGEAELERDVSEFLGKLNAAKHNGSAYIYDPDSVTSKEFLGVATESYIFNKLISTKTLSQFISPSPLVYRMNTTDDSITALGEKSLSTVIQTTETTSSTESITIKTDNANLADDNVGSSTNALSTAYIYDPDSVTTTDFFGIRTELNFLTRFATITSSPFMTIPILDHRFKTADDNVKLRGKIPSTDMQTILSTVSKNVRTRTEKERIATFAENAVRSLSNTLSTSENALTFTSSLKTNASKLAERKTTPSQDQSTTKSAATQKQRQNNGTSVTMGHLRGVDHESWENLVRAAPVMVGRLDETIPQKINDELENSKRGTETNQETNNPKASKKTNHFKQRVKKQRKKRFIQAIKIDDARPHNLATKREMFTGSATFIELSDIQQFAQLVELMDDDIHDRAALRYLSQYVGRPLYNLCRYSQPKPRYVYLFNSSRLVISIGNFTLRKMQLAITPAKRLLAGMLGCGESGVECQLNGNRVCIDVMNACDGVANCGEIDIYDEDRLICGGYMGLRHNVYLTAITFLAVLFTIIYIVHYWIGRCVPKVSEAFFVYTEGDENELNLESIMRSPNDMGFVIGKSFENFEAEATFLTSSTNESKIYSCIKKCFPCCFKRGSKDNVDSAEWNRSQLTNINETFSFPEIEINKIMQDLFKDVSVQTGESLEMKYVKTDKTNERKIAALTKKSEKTLTPSVSSVELQRAKDELNRIKFINKNRKDSLTSNSSSSLLLDDRRESFARPTTIHVPFSEEAETASLAYDGTDEMTKRKIKPNVNKPEAKLFTEADVHTQTQPTVMQSKQLRFNENVVNIRRGESDSEEEISALQYDESENINYDSLDESEPSAPSTSRDFKRFWSGSKGKKKKKTRAFPRNH